MLRGKKEISWVVVPRQEIIGNSGMRRKEELVFPKVNPNCLTNTKWSALKLYTDNNSVGCIYISMHILVIITIKEQKVMNLRGSENEEI